MARPLNFKIGKQVFDLVPLKLDRKKLYGWSEKIVLDPQDEPCNTLTLFQDKSIMIPKGGTGLGAISEAGSWIEKSDMMYVNEDGSPAELVPSSYDGEIELKETVSIEFLLEHNIASIYALQGEENHPDFVKAIAENKGIFTFVFNYRADFEGDPAFVLENDGEVFILVGKKIEFEFIGLDGAGALDEEDAEKEEVEDEFDFAMM